MRILTKKECDEILKRICANEIIQMECSIFIDIEAETKMIENRAEIASIVGGAKGMNKVSATIRQRAIKVLEDLEKKKLKKGLVRMLIRSQDRKRLLNFATVTEIRLGDSELEVEVVSSGFPYNMGRYKTQEKAKKVLDMIQEWYLIQKEKKPCYVSTDKKLKECCFQMPEDSEVE